MLSIRKIPSPARNQPNIIVTLDLSKQRLHLDTAESLFQEWDYKYYPKISDIKEDISGFLSSALLVAKAKQFDDGLYAAVELLSQEGTSEFCGKRDFLKQLAPVLKGFAENKNFKPENVALCRSFISAALELGGADPSDEPAEIADKAEDLTLEFLCQELKSKPISFYTWTEELINIFQQDRFLQSPLEDMSANMATIFASAITTDPQLQKTYAAYSSLIQKLANHYPDEYSDLNNIQEIDKSKKYCFFPPSRSVETELVKKLFGDGEAPTQGFNLIDHLISAIQEGTISLCTTEESGWHEYQLWAMEPFVIPEQTEESSQIKCSESYKKTLLEIFKATMATLRETQIKNMEIGEVTGRGHGYVPQLFLPYTIESQNSVEPTISYYLRQAQSYHFIRTVLESTFSEASLQTINRLFCNGTVAASLYQELLDMESLYYGVAQIGAREIGLSAASPDFSASLNGRTVEQQKADIKIAEKWLSTYTTDPDLARDNRMMVPVFFDESRQKTKVWVMLGYSVAPLQISYDTAPEVCTVTDERGNSFQPEMEEKIREHIEFGNTKKWLLTPISKELYVDKLLDREELRQLCDEIQSVPDIFRVLSGESSKEWVLEEKNMGVVYPYFVRCNELGGGYRSLDDGSFRLLTAENVARFLRCDGRFMVENKLADFLLNLQNPGLRIEPTPVLHNRDFTVQYDTHKELFIENEYLREHSNKRELLEDRIWLYASSYLIVTASLKEKLVASGFSYLSFRKDDWGL